MRKRQTATLAAWGMASQRRMRLVGFKPVTKGALRGFASVELSERSDRDGLSGARRTQWRMRNFTLEAGARQ